MKFGGQKYAYVSKKKLNKVNELKTQSEPMEAIPEKKEETFFDSSAVILDQPAITSTKGRRSTKRSKSKGSRGSRSRSGSLTKNRGVELDEVYSDEEDLDIYKQKDKEIHPKGGIDTGMFSALGKSIECRLSMKDKKQDITTTNTQKRKVLYSIANEQNDDKEFAHEVDTNVMSIRFEFLKDKVAFATGDPQKCSQCEAILSDKSVLAPLSDDICNKFLWTCEFCGRLNELTIEKEEIPTSSCVDYFVQSANQVNKQGLSYNYNDEQSIIFCFDISGSMCVSTPLAGKHKFKGSFLEKNLKELMAFSDGSDQFYNSQAKGMTYVSRLQCLQAAIENNISSVLKSAPSRRVGFVTFNNEVVCYGDGTKQPVKINGNNLNDYEMIQKIAEENFGIISAPLKDSYSNLLKQLYALEESGQTALGPAMLFSISMIKDVVPGSRIILCTDGISNLGLGAMDGKTEQKDLEDLKAFYTQLGLMAKERGIVINLITFEEEESKIEILMTMIEQTGGEIIRVKPTEILEQFSNLLSNEIIATNVTIKVKLHKVMHFRNEDSKSLQDDGSTLTKEIGNATKDSEVFFEYSFKKSEDIAKNFPDVDLEKLIQVPFQSIIEYTTPNGDKCIRVVTDTQQVSSEKDVIVNQAQFDVISTNAIKKTAKLAQEGHYREAQSNALAWKKFVKESAQTSEEAGVSYNIMKQNLCNFNNDLQEIQYNDATVGMSNAPTTTVTDKVSHMMYKLKNTSTGGTVRTYMEEKTKKKKK